MKYISIFVAKTAMFILKKLNKGTAYPGEIAKKLDPNILKHLKKPKLTIAVTSTNGKTSTSNIITNILKQNGYTVGHNSSGTNIGNGVVSLLIENCNFKGEITKDALVIEIDERHTKNIFKDFRPDYLVIGNITRDQAPRHGNLEVVMAALKQGIFDDIHIVMNIDDPIVNKLTIDHKGEKTLYGIKKTKDSYKKDLVLSLDISACPKCGSKLKFDYFHYGNTGKYDCPNCDFKRIKPDFEVTKIDYEKKYYIINNITKIPLQNDVFFHVYNTLAAYSVLKQTDIKEEKIVEGLNKIDFSIVRFENLKLDDRKCVILSCKNETPNSYDQSLLHITRNKEKKTVVFGFNRICSRYDYADLTWLYDVDFELLNQNKIDKIVCVGKFRYDLATRLIHAGIDEKNIIMCETLENLIDTLKTKTKGNIYAALNFDIVRVFAEMVKGVEK